MAVKPAGGLYIGAAGDGVLRRGGCCQRGSPPRLDLSFGPIFNWVGPDEPHLHSNTLRFPRTTQSSREDRDAAPTSYRVVASSGTTTPSRGSALYLYEAEIDECCLEQER